MSSIIWKDIPNYLRHDKKKWVAQITYNYKNIYLGSFDTEEQAYEAYKKAAKKYQGETARIEIDACQDELLGIIDTAELIGAQQ